MEENKDRISLAVAIKEEIFTMLDNYIDSLSKLTIIPDENYIKQKDQLEEEIELTRNKLEEEKKQAESIKKEKEQLNQFIEEDKNEYQIALTEINERKPFLTEKEIIKQSLKDELGRIDCKMHLLDLKLGKREEEDVTWKEKATRQANNFRKYLGIDIKPEVKHVLRVSFDLDEESYFLIDFRDKPRIVDLWPIFISVKDAQEIYDNFNDFYEFCKFIRNIFKNKLIV